MTPALLRATAYIVEKHDGQYRKCEDEGRKIPYATHPMRVSKMLIDAGIADEPTLVAALLHDVLEDTDTDYRELLDVFGREAADIVVELTDDKSLPKDVRKAKQLDGAPRLSLKAARIKLADKLDNVTSLVEYRPPWDDERKLAYASHAEQVVDALVSPHPRLLVPFKKKVAELRTSLRA